VRPVEHTSAPRHSFGRAQQLDMHEERELCMRAFAQFDTDGNGMFVRVRVRVGDWRAVCAGSLDPEEFKVGAFE
jgi:hypothetical protein